MKIFHTQLPKSNFFKNPPGLLNAEKVIVVENAQSVPLVSFQNTEFHKAGEIWVPLHLLHESWRESIDQTLIGRVAPAVPIVTLIENVAMIFLFGDTLLVLLSYISIGKTGMEVVRHPRMIVMFALLLAHAMIDTTMKIALLSPDTETTVRENQYRPVTTIGPATEIESVIETGTETEIGIENENPTANVKGRETLRRAANSPRNDANLGAGTLVQNILEYGKEWLLLLDWRLLMALLA